MINDKNQLLHCYTVTLVIPQFRTVTPYFFVLFSPLFVRSICYRFAKISVKMLYCLSKDFIETSSRPYRNLMVNLYFFKMIHILAKRSHYVKMTNRTFLYRVCSLSISGRYWVIIG